MSLFLTILSLHLAIMFLCFHHGIRNKKVIATFYLTILAFLSHNCKFVSQIFNSYHAVLSLYLAILSLYLAILKKSQKPVL